MNIIRLLFAKCRSNIISEVKKQTKNNQHTNNKIIIKEKLKMSYEVRNFIEKIVFAVVAFAALCLFCFDIMGAVAQPLSFLALLFPILGVVLYIIPTPDFTK